MIARSRVNPIATLQRWLVCVVSLVQAFVLVPQVTNADVIVLSNQHRKPIRIYLPGQGENGEMVSYQLPGGQVLPVRTIGPTPFAYQSEVGTVRTTLLPNAVYKFNETSDSRLLLKQVDLSGDETTARSTGVAKRNSLLKVAELPIKILVDEEEQATRELWEKRLRKRVSVASNILEQACLLRLKVVEFGTWKSDNRLKGFPEAFQEFTQIVDPGPARLAIGFTSQFAVPKKPGKVGLSSGLFKGHILLRESAPQATEVELVEALLHELGHVLGAVDQQIGNSLMRPGLIDGQARRADFPLQFDPVNLLLVNLVGEEIRLRNVQGISDLQPSSRTRLKQIYTQLGLAPKPQPAKPEPPEKIAQEKVHRESAGESDTVASTAGKKTEQTSGKKPKAGKRTTPHPDLEKLQGQWKVVSVRRRGKAVPEALRYTPTLSENKLTLQAKDLGTFRFRMDIDPENEATELPKSAPIPFDLVMRVQNKDYVTHGIYEYDGTELKVCCARPGKPRPEKFKAPVDVDQVVMIFRREE